MVALVEAGNVRDNLHVFKKLKVAMYISLYISKQHFAVIVDMIIIMDHFIVI